MINATMPTKSKLSLTNILLLLGIITIGIMYVNSCNDKTRTAKEQTNFVNSLYDSIHTINLRNGDNVTTISALQATFANAFVNLEIKDSEIVALQKVVDSYKKQLKAGSSVTNVAVDTYIDKTTPNVYDTVYSYGISTIKTDTIRLSTNYSNKWVKYSIVSNEDSTNLKLSITNSYSVILGYNKKVPFVDVINYNPYSEVKKLRAFMITMPKEKRWGVGFSAGIGFSTDLKARPYIGFGINYNVIKF